MLGMLRVCWGGCEEGVLGRVRGCAGEGRYAGEGEGVLGTGRVRATNAQMNETHT